MRGACDHGAHAGRPAQPRPVLRCIRQHGLWLGMEATAPAGMEDPNRARDQGRVTLGPPPACPGPPKPLSKVCQHTLEDASNAAPPPQRSGARSQGTGPPAPGRAPPPRVTRRGRPRPVRNHQRCRPLSPRSAFGGRPPKAGPLEAAGGLDRRARAGLQGLVSRHLQRPISGGKRAMAGLQGLISGGDSAGDCGPGRESARALPPRGSAATDRN